MVKVVARSIVKDENLEEYIKLAKKMVEATRVEEGCIFYSLHQEIDNPNMLTFIEAWRDKECLDKHLQSEHIKTIAPKLRTMRENSEMNVYRDLFEV